MSFFFRTQLYNSQIPGELGAQPYFSDMFKNHALHTRFRQTNSYNLLCQNPSMGHFGIFPGVTGIQLVIVVSVRHSWHMAELPILGREDSLTPDGDTSSIEWNRTQAHKFTNSHHPVFIVIFTPFHFISTSHHHLLILPLYELFYTNSYYTGIHIPIRIISACTTNWCLSTYTPV